MRPFSWQEQICKGALPIHWIGEKEALQWLHLGCCLLQTTSVCAAEILCADINNARNSGMESSCMQWETNKQCQVVTIVNQINLSSETKVQIQHHNWKARASKTWATKAQVKRTNQDWESTSSKNLSCEGSSHKKKPGLWKFKFQKLEQQSSSQTNKRDWESPSSKNQSYKSSSWRNRDMQVCWS